MRRAGDHRAPPQAVGQRRGGHDGDVPGGRIHQEDRGRLRDPLGVELLPRDRLQPQREGVRLGRGIEEPLSRPGLPLRLRRRNLPEARLGRRPRERRRHDRHRHRRRRLPRGHRRRRGLHGSRWRAGGSSFPSCGPAAFAACG